MTEESYYYSLIGAAIVGIIIALVGLSQKKYWKGSKKRKQ